MRTVNDVWRVRIDHVDVATVQLPGSDTDWSLIGKFHAMVSDVAGTGTRVTLASDANERGTLLTGWDDRTDPTGCVRGGHDYDDTSRCEDCGHVR